MPHDTVSVKVTCAALGAVLAMRPVLKADPGEPLPWGNKDGGSGRLSHRPEISQHCTPRFCGPVAQEVRGGVVFVLTTVAGPGPLPRSGERPLPLTPRIKKITARQPVTPEARDPVATCEGLFLNPREQHRLSLEVASVQAAGGYDPAREGPRQAAQLLPEMGGSSRGLRLAGAF